MNRIAILSVLSFLVVTSLAFAGTPDLVGTWTIDSKCMRIGDNMDHTADGVILLQTHQMVITWQDQDLFKGYSCDAEVPNGIFFGAIDKKEVYITNWDSINRATLNGKGSSMEYIGQSQLWNTPNAPATCMGTAVKVSETFDCDPAPL